MGCCNGSQGVDQGKSFPQNPSVVSRLNADIKEFYTFEQDLGEGQFGSVRRAVHKSTGATRAIKIVPRKNWARGRDRAGKGEVEIMKTMDHPCIIKLFETFEDKRWVHLVMELCQGGDLFSRILEQERFSEPHAAKVMQQMFMAIRYMHGVSICHRDLKPENLLFLTTDPIEQNTLKLTDFGVSLVVSGPDDCMYERIGTPFYVAPQVLTGCYTQTCDNWSAGVIMYTLLSGNPPFYAEYADQVLEKVKAGIFSFPRKTCGHISEDAKDLIRALLEVDQEKRMTSAAALEHTWVKNQAPQATDAALPANLLKNLENFRSQSLLKKAALHVIASHLNNNQIRELRRAFLALDQDGDGRLNADDLERKVEGLNAEDLENRVMGNNNNGFSRGVSTASEIVDGIDMRKTGGVEYTDFLAAALESRLYLQEDLVWYAFNVFDKDGDGIISKDELEAVFKGWNFGQLRGGGGGGIEMGDKSVGVSEDDEASSWARQVSNMDDGGLDYQGFKDLIRIGSGDADPLTAPANNAEEEAQEGTAPTTI